MYFKNKIEGRVNRIRGRRTPWPSSRAGGEGGRKSSGSRRGGTEGNNNDGGTKNYQFIYIYVYIMFLIGMDALWYTFEES